MSTFGGLLDVDKMKLLRTIACWDLSVRAACARLCVLYDDGSAGLWGLNGRGARGCHHPSKSA